MCTGLNSNHYYYVGHWSYLAVVKTIYVDALNASHLIMIFYDSNIIFFERQRKGDKLVSPIVTKELDYLL
jgi:hypothetical protein